MNVIFCFCLPCLRNTESFILPRYRKSRGTSHYTTKTKKEETKRKERVEGPIIRTEKIQEKQEKIVVVVPVVLVPLPIIIIIIIIMIRPSVY